MKNKTQSEQELEDRTIERLEAQGYEYLGKNPDLFKNLKTQIEKLNHLSFSDIEFKEQVLDKLFERGSTLFKKALRLREPIQIQDKITKKIRNIKLIDKNNPSKNIFQVASQVVLGDTTVKGESHRYDITILINGFPLVQVELKKRGVI